MQNPSVAKTAHPRGARWRSVVVTLAALIGIGVTARLGWWQLDRAAQKEALAAQMAARAAAPPLDGRSLFGAAAQAQAQAQELQHRPVSLQGEWLPAHTVHLDNRQMAGKVGFFVLTPLRLSGGDADRVVLVQRGWAPRNFSDRMALPPVQTPAGRVRVDGRIALAPSKLLELSGNAPPADGAGVAGAPRIRQNLDLAAFRAETGLPLAAFTVVQTGAASDGLQRDWAPPATDVAKHHGYAFQWFGLATLIAVLYVWFQLVRPHCQRRAARSTD